MVTGLIEEWTPWVGWTWWVAAVVGVGYLLILGACAAAAVCILVRDFRAWRRERRDPLGQLHALVAEHDAWRAQVWAELERRNPRP